VQRTSEVPLKMTASMIDTFSNYCSFILFACIYIIPILSIPFDAIYYRIHYNILLEENKNLKEAIAASNKMHRDLVEKYNELQDELDDANDL
jgi:hypothetical protein